MACEIEIGHQSTALCHLANISYRVGKEAPVEELREQVKHHEDAVNTMESMVKQLESLDIDLKKWPFIVGPKLTYDVKAEQFTGDHASAANELVRREYRDPFVVPEEV